MRQKHAFGNCLIVIKMLKTIAILTALASVAVAHWPVNSYTDNTYGGYGGNSFGDWNGRGIVSDVTGGHSYVNNGPWFTGNGGHRTGSWVNSYPYNGGNGQYGAYRWNGWYGASAPLTAASADAAYDTYAPTYANSVYGYGNGYGNGFGNGYGFGNGFSNGYGNGYGYGHGYGYGSRYGRANYDNTPYSRYY